MRRSRTGGRIATVALVALAATTPLRAQSVIGRVVDATTGDPVEGVTTRLTDQAGVLHMQALTDSAGWFYLPAGGPGSYILSGEVIGYESFSSAPLQLDASHQLEVEVTLRTEPVPLDPIRVVADRALGPSELSDFYARAAWIGHSGSGTVFLRDDIRDAHPGRISRLLERIPTRLRCPMSYMLDGYFIDPVELDAAVDPERVEGIEVYSTPSQVPLEYQPRVQCGLTMVWRTPQGQPGAQPPVHLALLSGAALAASTLLLLWVVR